MLDISQVAKRSGLPASTLRYYEEKGLIASKGRRGLRRLFAAGIVDELAFISLAQAAGFSLQEIVPMMQQQQPRVNRAALRTKAVEIDRKIRELTAVREALQHAAECPAPSHLECPKFRRLMRIALRRQRQQRRG